MTNQSIYPEGITKDTLEGNCFDLGYCTRWVIDNDNMDYLKADETGKCPDGTQLSWTVTSCN